MKILIELMNAGNNSPVLKNDLSQINDELLKIGAVTKTIHEKLYNIYILKISQIELNGFSHKGI